MSIITTLIVLALFYGSGAIVCHTAETGTCAEDATMEIQTNE